MNVEAYIMAWDEAETIHLTIKHYQKFCSRIIVFDNYSDDGTPEIARSMGCEVKQFGIPGVLDDREYTNLKNNCWKGSQADWVIIVDADEIVVPWDSSEDIKYVLSRNLGFKLLQASGWQVVGYTIPKENWIDYTIGYADDSYSKLVCFVPKNLKEIGYIHGCHQARPKYKDSNIIVRSQIRLLHYRNVGGPDRLIQRHALYRSRMSEWNKQWGCGIHYTYSDERRKEEWIDQLANSVELPSRGIASYSSGTSSLDAG